MQKFLKPLVLVFFVTALSITMNGAITLNDLACSFTDVPDKEKIEQNVVVGASNFLSSHATFSLFLAEYEKSSNQPADLEKMHSHLAETIALLEISKDFYIRAREIGARIGYIEKKTGWFRAYNYENIIVNHSLKPEIALQVKSFLATGDILGVYQKNISNIDNLIERLTKIQLGIAKKVKPKVEIIWKIMEEYSDTLKFGTYSTIMGKTVLNNCEVNLSDEGS